jgi:hypothetical protein
MWYVLITVGLRPELFARLNTGVLGSNPTRNMDVCLRLFFVLSYVGSGLATG